MAWTPPLSRSTISETRNHSPMGWRVHFIGRPHAIKKALQNYERQLSGPQRLEFHEVRPVLEALVDLNARNDSDFSLQAMGEGFSENGSGISVYLSRSDALHVQ